MSFVIAYEGKHIVPALTALNDVLKATKNVILQENIERFRQYLITSDRGVVVDPKTLQVRYLNEDGVSFPDKTVVEYRTIDTFINAVLSQRKDTSANDSPPTENYHNRQNNMKPRIRYTGKHVLAAIEAVRNQGLIQEVAEALSNNVGPVVAYPQGTTMRRKESVLRLYATDSEMNRFNTTDYDNIDAFLDAIEASQKPKIEHPNITIAGEKVDFAEDGKHIKVGCQVIDALAVKVIHEHLVTLQKAQ